MKNKILKVQIVTLTGHGGSRYKVCTFNDEKHMQNYINKIEANGVKVQSHKILNQQS